MNKLSYIILDDDQAFCLWLESKMKKHMPNFEALGSYHSTLEGLLAISRKKPDVLFLDMNIDGLNGMDVLELMKYEPATILISSSPRETFDIKEANSISAFLHKPIAIDDLVIETEKLTRSIKP